DDGIGREGTDLHGPQIHGADAATDAIRIEHRAQKFPVLIFLDATFRLVAPDLLIESVEKLLSGGGAGECGAIVESAAEASKIQQSLGGAIEGNAHAVEQINDPGSGVTHGFNRRLVGEKVAAVDGVVKMLPGGVAFAFEVLGGVDTALRTHG